MLHNVIRKIGEPVKLAYVDQPRAHEEFAGVALVMSRNRWFLDSICKYLVVFEGDPIAKMYIGNWSDYETMMMEKFGKDLTPHHMKYRTMKR